MQMREAQWRDRFEAWQASGQSGAAFCRAHGLNYAQWMYWRRRLERGSATAAAPMLVPIQVCASEVGTDVMLSRASRPPVRVQGLSIEQLAQLLGQLGC